MISDEQEASIRYLFHAGHWKIGTIAAKLGCRAYTVRRALEPDHYCSHATRLLPAGSIHPSTLPPALHSYLLFLAQ